MVLAYAVFDLHLPGCRGLKEKRMIVRSLKARIRSIGLPGLSGFVGEFLSIIGTFVVHRPYAILSAAGVILAAVYMLWAFQRVFTGEPSGENATFRDLDRVELTTMTVSP